MKTEELELQSKRVAQGDKIQLEMYTLRNLYTKISESQGLSLYTSRNISKIGYGDTFREPDWEFSFLTKTEIDDLCAIVHQKMLEKVRFKLDELKKKFEEL